MKANKAMVIVFGGSFNPPTIAHLKIIEKLLSEFKDSKVLVLPVGDDYKKKDLASINDRIEMLKCMTADIKGVIISDLEAVRPYQGTLASLKQLNQTYPKIAVAVGADQLPNLKDWINYKELLATYTFIVMARKHHSSSRKAVNMFDDIQHDFKFIYFKQDISSTQVRNQQELRKKHLTPAVYKYIQDKNLYKE